MYKKETMDFDLSVIGEGMSHTQTTKIRKQLQSVATKKGHHRYSSLNTDLINIKQEIFNKDNTKKHARNFSLGSDY